jgi:hypothetical protein
LAIDAVAAQRVYDSTIATGRELLAAGGRDRSAFPGVQELRRIRFSAPHEGVELAVDTKGDEVLLSGRLTSGRPATVTVRWPGGEQTAPTDLDGTFRCHALPVEPLSLQATTAAGESLKTGWILP